MAAVTPPPLSDSDDDYQIIDNGPVDLPLLNNAMESDECRPENEPKADNEKERKEADEEGGSEAATSPSLSKGNDDSEGDSPLAKDGCARTLEGSNTVEPEDAELKRKKKMETTLAAIQNETQKFEKKLFYSLFVGFILICVTARFGGDNGSEKQQLEAYVKQLEQSVFSLKDEIKWGDETIKAFNKHLNDIEENHRTLYIDQQARNDALAAENDRLRKMVNEMKEETDLQEPFRNVSLHHWKFKFSVLNVFVVNVTRGEGILRGDQIFAVNDVPVKKLLSSDELASLINKADRPVRLVVRQNPNGLKALEQLHKQLAKQRTDWTRSKLSVK